MKTSVAPKCYRFCLIFYPFWGQALNVLGWKADSAALLLLLFIYRKFIIC